MSVASEKSPTRSKNRHRYGGVGLVLVAVCWPLTSGALPGYQDTVPNGSVYSCDMCHGASAAFQQDYNDAGRKWTAGLASMDSDGDGFSNGWELQDPSGAWSTGQPDPGSELLVTNPSVSSDTPAPPVEVDPATVMHDELAGENGQELLAVQNVGAVPFDWMLTPDESWMTPDPDAETDLPAGMEDVVSLLFTTDGLDPGDYEGSLALTIPGIDAAEIPPIPVALTVPEPGAVASLLAVAGAVALMRRRRRPHAAP